MLASLGCGLKSVTLSSLAILSICRSYWPKFQREKKLLNGTTRRKGSFHATLLDKSRTSMERRKQ
jgi:hypothetical protein